ncbi:MAG TPA: PEP-CTERM sorting domain-containing protein [Nitrosomonas sp.]|jgi:probable HAF family extracellular repeat protein|nr:PEP-CTERM sorting domain-containing protein [Candidatus Brachybacter algidus]HRB97013.1 PEP-CTERM sorting domain-containing protein [Nitrosomonas sp.]
MNTTFLKYKRITTLLAGISMASIPAVGQAGWSIVDLSNNVGGRYGKVIDLNDSGQVIGVFEDSDRNAHPFITGSDGFGMTGLDTLGRDNFTPMGINNSGQVVSMMYNADYGSPHTVITGSNGVGATDLGSLGGHFYAWTRGGINDSGQLAGQFGSGGEEHAFITGPNGVGFTDLGALPGGYISIVNAVNNSGQVVGSSYTTNGWNGWALTTHAFITGPNGVGMTDPGTLGTAYRSDAADLNDSGQVVGQFGSSTGFGAFITGTNGVGMTDLGTLGGLHSNATGINDSGEVVGRGQAADGDFHAFLFSHGGMTDLNLLDVMVATGWMDIEVLDINNNGQILGNAYDANTSTDHGFLLSYTPDTIFDPQPYVPSSPIVPISPIPEPQTYAMLLAGLGLIGFMARRRKETAA